MDKGLRNEWRDMHRRCVMASDVCPWFSKGLASFRRGAFPGTTSRGGEPPGTVKKKILR